MRSDVASVILSIDFEMRWGVHDVYGLNFDGYRKNLENCRPAVVATLELLRQRGLRATWATVGALGANDWHDYYSFAPPPPNYLNKEIAIRHDYAELDPTGILHFAPDLIRRILATEGQELGSHSFSHLYFREPGVTAADFVADMAAVERLWNERFGAKPVSLVFPRNQSAFLDRLGDTGIRVWRDTELGWYFNCNSQSDNTILPRALRLYDSINPWGRRVARIEGNVAGASLFVRFGLPEAFWRLHLRRIRRELNSLDPGETVHYWWHPHNIGFDLAIGMDRLEQLMDLVADACVKRNVVSCAMRDCIDL